MGHVSTMFKAVHAWWMKKLDGFKAVRKWQAPLRWLHLEIKHYEAGNDSALPHYFSFDEFKAIFEWKDGAYYVGNHRLVESFGVEEMRRLQDLMLRTSSIEWDIETSSILIKSKYVLLPPVVMNTNVLMANAHETVNNLKAQWLMKRREQVKAMTAKDTPDKDTPDD